LERPLNNDLGASGHGRDGRVDSGLVYRNAVNNDDGQSLSLKMPDVLCLMALASFGQNVEKRVPGGGALSKAICDPAIEHGQVPAI
jgi:hypothetical protein